MGQYWRAAKTAERHGKPRIRGPNGVPALTFDISNTAGLVACVIGLRRAVGVDVESLERGPEVLDVAARCFAPAEHVQLVSMSPERRLERFYEYWTLKEAYLKARGTGLSMQPELIAFELDPDRSIRVVLDPRTGDVSARWQFLQMRPSKSHVLAAAIERTGDRDGRFRVIDGAPFLAANAIVSG